MPFDQLYIDDYNKLISDFQSKAMALCIKSCERRITTNENTIIEYKQQYSTVSDLDAQLNKLKKDAENGLKSHFDHQNEKINRYSPQKLTVRAFNSNQKDSSFNSQYNNDQIRHKNYGSRRTQSSFNSSSSQYHNNNKQPRLNSSSTRKQNNNNRQRRDFSRTRHNNTQNQNQSRSRNNYNDNAHRSRNNNNNSTPNGQNGHQVHFRGDDSFNEPH